MSNIAVNNLTYTGIVTLSQYINKNKIVIKKIKNSGGIPLFNFLTDCLAGDFEIASIDRPTKIMLLKKSDDQAVPYTKASGFIYLQTKPEKECSDSSSSVCYSFIIPQEYLTDDFTYIGLYTHSATEQDLGEYAAICEPKLELMTLSPSAVLAIDWKLTISNHAVVIDNT